MNYSVYDNLFITESVINKIPEKCSLKSDINNSIKKIKVKNFTILFMDEVDYKTEIQSIKESIKNDNWEQTINDIVNKEEPDIFKNASHKSYYVTRYSDGPDWHYIVFKCNNKDDEAYNKFVIIKIKYLESIKEIIF